MAYRPAVIGCRGQGEFGQVSLWVICGKHSSTALGEQNVQNTIILQFMEWSMEIIAQLQDIWYNRPFCKCIHILKLLGKSR